MDCIYIIPYSGGKGFKPSFPDMRRGADRSSREGPPLPCRETQGSRPKQGTDAAVG